MAFLSQSINGNAQVAIGTATAPALSYITGNGDLSTGQWTIYGSLLSLGDIALGGGVTLTFNGDFIDCLPPHLVPCHRQLEVTCASITGPDASRFSVSGGFQPFLVGRDPFPLPVHFSDSLATPGTSYQASLVLSTRDAPGDSGGTNLADLTFVLKARTRGQTSGVGGDGLPLPVPVRIARNEPNPFRAGTRIDFETEVDGPGSLTIYDALGRRVVSLLEAPLTAGRHEAVWDGRDGFGEFVPAGTYFARLTVAGSSATRKLLRSGSQ
jgi:hypothetical protein